MGKAAAGRTPITPALRPGRLSALLVFAVVCGCTEVDHGNRLPLAGIVTIQEQPLGVRGTIFFDPMQSEGTGASAEVAADGKFNISEETGPTPGQKYNVTLITWPEAPAEGAPADQVEKSQTYKQVVDVPARGDDPVELSINFGAPATSRR